MPEVSCCGRARRQPACRGGHGARFHGPRGGFPPPGRGTGQRVQEQPGAYTMTWYFPVTVCLVADVCGNFGRAFWVRGECRSRPGRFRACRWARAAASAAAAIAARDEVAVTWLVSMERTAWRQAAVNDSSSAVTGRASLRRRARAAASSPRSVAASLARTSWVPASQAQASCSTSGGEPERKTGPLVRFPAPAMVALSSPKVVSDAVHLFG